MYTMSTTTTRRILCVVPLAAAVVLSVGACGNTPWAKGSNASSSTSSSAANARTALRRSRRRARAGRPEWPVREHHRRFDDRRFGRVGVRRVRRLGVRGSGGSVSGGSGQSGLASGSSGSVSTAGMSPDDVGKYCKIAGGLGSPEDQNTYTFRAAVPDLVELKKHTPVQLQPDVELLANDFKALGDESRVLVQVKDEVDTSYKRVMDFHEQICTVH